MATYKLKIAEMIPNAWFNKLIRDSSRNNSGPRPPTKKKVPSPATTSQEIQVSQPRKSSTRAEKSDNPRPPTNTKLPDQPDPPRKSSRRSSRRKTVYKPSRRTSNSSYGTETLAQKIVQDYYFFSSSESSPEPELIKSDRIDGSTSLTEVPTWPSYSTCIVTSSTTDIIIDMTKRSYYSGNFDGIDVFEASPEPVLPQILAPPVLKVLQSPNSESAEILLRPKSELTTEGTPAPPESPIKKVEACGPRSAPENNKSYGAPRRSFSESVAIVKSSVDPLRDFKCSMVEMIVENNIRAPEDLEELLACYLTLNANEYHDLIVKAFAHIWFLMAELRL